MYHADNGTNIKANKICAQKHNVPYQLSGGGHNYIKKKNRKIN